jgi:hypothetical protein
MQNLPIGYTNSVSYLKAVGLIGDSWTVDIIKHILSHINE